MKKQLIIGASDKGGGAKSGNTSFLIDSFNQLGIRFEAIDADDINRTLSKMYPPATCCSIHTTDDLDRLFNAAAESAAEIIVVDLPGSAGRFISEFVEGISFEFLQEIGLRVILGLHVTNDAKCFDGLLPWIGPFAEKAEFIAFLNERDGPFQLNKFPVGEILAKLVDHREITVPRLLENDYQAWKDNPGLLADFIDPQSAINQKLKLLPSVRQRFVMARRSFLRSLEPHLDFITGKKAPTPAKSKGPRT